MKLYVIIGLILMMSACKSSNNKAVSQTNTTQNTEVASDQTPGYIINKRGDKLPLVIKSEEEWKSELTADEYYVLRQKGTERSFTSDLNSNKKEGLYTCAACNTTLFTSKTKFDSGTGWPSFYAPEDENLIKEDSDNLLGYTRTEVLCARCNGHLGHVFDDGPPPTGLRYCINGVSLDFVKTEY